MSFKPKLWLTLGAALTLTAACSEQGGEAGSGAGEGGSSAVAGEGEGGEGEGGEGEGGASAGVGEAGAAAGYAGVPADSLLALRLAHLAGAGFQRVTDLGGLFLKLAAGLGRFGLGVFLVCLGAGRDRAGGQRQGGGDGQKRAIALMHDAVS